MIFTVAVGERGTKVVLRLALAAFFLLWCIHDNSRRSLELMVYSGIHVDVGFGVEGLVVFLIDEAHRALRPAKSLWCHG